VAFRRHIAPSFFGLHRHHSGIFFRAQLGLAFAVIDFHLRTIILKLAINGMIDNLV
jgi:hypothetical protein